MKLLLDNNLSPWLATELCKVGHDATHVLDIGMHAASDREILEFALSQGSIVISNDKDFGQIIAQSNLARPSVILLRQLIDPKQQLALLIENLPSLSEPLGLGALISLDSRVARVKLLPILPRRTQ